MAQSPKPATPKKTAPKSQAVKAKVATEKKTIKKTAEKNKDNISLNASTLSSPAVPAFLNTQIPTTELSSTHLKENVFDDIEAMDFDMPKAGETDNQQINKDQVDTQEFTQFIIPSGCGNVLKTEREAQGLTLSEVCKSLRLSASQIQAIEEDDFENLPKQSIVRGFIRNYARLLRIDAEPILKSFQNIVPEEAPLSLSVKATADDAVIGAKEMKFTPKIIANIAFVIIVLFALAYLYTHYIKPQAKAVDKLALSADEIQKNSPDMMALPLPNTSNSVSDVANQNTAVASTATDSTTNTIATNVPNGTSATSSTISSTFEKKLSSPAATDAKSNNIESTSTLSTSNNTSQLNTTTTSAASSSTNPIIINPLSSPVVNVPPQAGESQLSFKLNEQSWIRVETPDGKKIFSELLQAGSNQVINIKPPFNIIIGNAGATKVYIDNQDYDLMPVTRANVARIQIK